MKRSHSRQSYPFDKLLPWDTGRDLNSIARQCLKKMHKKKQRQYNNIITNKKRREK